MYSGLHLTYPKDRRAAAERTHAEEQRREWQLAADGGGRMAHAAGVWGQSRGGRLACACTPGGTACSAAGGAGAPPSTNPAGLPWPPCPGPPWLDASLRMPWTPRCSWRLRRGGGAAAQRPGAQQQPHVPAREPQPHGAQPGRQQRQRPGQQVGRAAAAGAARVTMSEQHQRSTQSAAASAATAPSSHLESIHPATLTSPPPRCKLHICGAPQAGRLVQGAG